MVVADSLTTLSLLLFHVMSEPIIHIFWAMSLACRLARRLMREGILASSVWWRKKEGQGCLTAAQKCGDQRPSTDTLLAPANLSEFKDYTLDSPISS